MTPYIIDKNSWHYRMYADPGVVKLAYLSWKDKYCAKITFDYVQKQ